MTQAIDENRMYLHQLGVSNETDQQWVIDNLPCGIYSVERAWTDKTPFQVNGVRAIIIANWKGIVTGLAMANGRETSDTDRAKAEL